MFDTEVHARTFLVRYSRLLLSLSVLLLVFLVTGTAAAVDGGAVDPGAFADVTLGDVSTNGSGDYDGGPTNP